MQLFFHEPVHMMGEVIENDFTFTIFDSVHYSSERCSKIKTNFFFIWSAVNLRNAAENL